jgi:hypothetical protein
MLSLPFVSFLYSLSPYNLLMSLTAMYHGFEWYGRVLEVREVGTILANPSLTVLITR